MWILILIVLLVLLFILQKNTETFVFNYAPEKPISIKNNKLTYDQVQDKYRIFFIPVLKSQTTYPLNDELQNTSKAYTPQHIKKMTDPVIKLFNDQNGKKYILNETVDYTKYKNFEYFLVSIFDTQFATSKLLEMFFDNGVLDYANEYQANKMANILYPEYEPEKFYWFKGINQWKLNTNPNENQLQNQPMDWNKNVNNPYKQERALFP